MKTIALTQNQVTIVDDDDYESLSQFKWYAKHDHNVWYAVRTKHNIRMHAAIMKTPRGFHTDHINGNGLDNRRENLRIVTPNENQCNRVKNRAGRLPGCYYHKPSKAWKAHIQVKGVRRSLGYYKTEEEAHAAYMEALHEVLRN